LKVYHNTIFLFVTYSPLSVTEQLKLDSFWRKQDSLSGEQLINKTLGRQTLIFEIAESEKLEIV